jgi:hypothetical protein
MKKNLATSRRQSHGSSKLDASWLLLTLASLLRRAVPAALLTAICAAALAGFDPAADAPDPGARPAYAGPPVESYAQALQAWRRPEDLNDWIGARFEYDNARALQLSESERTAGRAPPIAEAAAFFARPVGICVDLSRFAVESLRAIAPEVEPRYLMIEFDPLLRSRQVLRRHWIASIRRGGEYYFLADSRYPGRIYGPYPSVAAFVAGYAELQRPVVAWREMDGFRRQSRAESKQKSGI